jgi:hypothetical protein
MPRMVQVTKPGLFGRAIAVAYWLSGGQSAEWWARGILAVGVAVAQFAIVSTTIGPPVMEWIEGKEYVEQKDDAT